MIKSFAVWCIYSHPGGAGKVAEVKAKRMLAAQERSPNFTRCFTLASPDTSPHRMKFGDHIQNFSPKIFSDSATVGSGRAHQANFCLQRLGRSPHFVKPMAPLKSAGPFCGDPAPQRRISVCVEVGRGVGLRPLCAGARARMRRDS